MASTYARLTEPLGPDIVSAQAEGELSRPRVNRQFASFQDRAASLYASFQGRIEYEKAEAKQAALGQLDAAYAAYREKIGAQNPEATLYKGAKEPYEIFYGALCGILQGMTGCAIEEASAQLQRAEALYLLEKGRAATLASTCTFTASGSSGEQKQLTVAQQEDYKFAQLSQEQRDDFARCKVPFNATTPAWFKELSPWEQTWLLAKQNEMFTAVLPAATIVPVASPLARNLPGNVNHSRHSFTVTAVPAAAAASATGGAAAAAAAATDIVGIDSLRVRCAIPTPFEVKDKAEQLRLTQDNIAALIDAHVEEIRNRRNELWGYATGVQWLPVLVNLQTLLYGGTGGGKEYEMVVAKDGALATMPGARVIGGAVAGIKKEVTGSPDIDIILTTTNHAINWGRFVPDIAMQVKNEQAAIAILQRVAAFLRAVYGDRSMDLPAVASADNTEVITPLVIATALHQLHSLSQSTPQLLENLGAMKRAVLALPADIRLKTQLLLLLNATHDYINLWQTFAVSGNGNRALYLASLEEIMVEAMGGLSIGACRSGKDRKGVETLHTDSMLLFFALEGRLPQFTNAKDDAKLASIFTELFLKTEYPEKVASESAPGSYGVKNLDVVLSNSWQKELANRAQGMLAAEQAALGAGAKISPAREEFLNDVIGISQKAANLNRLTDKSTILQQSKLSRAAAQASAAVKAPSQVAVFASSTATLEAGGTAALLSSSSASNQAVSLQPWFNGDSVQEVAQLPPAANPSPFLQDLSRLLEQLKQEQVITKYSYYVHHDETAIRSRALTAKAQTGSADFVGLRIDLKVASGKKFEAYGVLRGTVKLPVKDGRAPMVLPQDHFQMPNLEGLNADEISAAVCQTAKVFCKIGYVALNTSGLKGRWQVPSITVSGASSNKITPIDLLQQKFTTAIKMKSNANARSASNF